MGVPYEKGKYIHGGPGTLCSCSYPRGKRGIDWNIDALSCIASPYVFDVMASVPRFTEPLLATSILASTKTLHTTALLFLQTGG